MPTCQLLASPHLHQLKMKYHGILEFHSGQNGILISNFSMQSMTIFAPTWFFKKSAKHLFHQLKMKYHGILEFHTGQNGIQISNFSLQNITFFASIWIFLRLKKCETFLIWIKADSQNLRIYYTACWGRIWIKTLKIQRNNIFTNLDNNWSIRWINRNKKLKLKSKYFLLV